MKLKKRNFEWIGVVLPLLLALICLVSASFGSHQASLPVLGALSGLYEKQRSIWGVAIIHYVLGQAAACLGFLS